MLQLHVFGVPRLIDLHPMRTRDVHLPPRPLALLTYLATSTTERSHRRDVLVALFWSDLPDGRARNALSQILFRLRRAVGHELLPSTGQEEVKLAPGALWCDAAAFREAYRADDYARTIELYRGEFLEGVHVPGAPEFERWAEAQRDRYRREVLQATSKLAADAEARGELLRATLHLQDAIQLDPGDERPVRRLLGLLAEAGEVTAARARFSTYERDLQRNHGLQPSEDLRRFAATLARTDPTRPRRSQEADEDTIRSLVIMPLLDITGSGGPGSLADGVTRTMIHALGRSRHLRVLSHTTVRQYRGVPLWRVAEELEVDAVLDGMFVRGRDHVRISVQLVRRDADAPIRSYGVEGGIREILMLEQELAARVAEDVCPDCDPAGGVTVRPATVSPEAYAAYLSGRDLQELFGGPALAESIECFEEALEAEPALALAYAGLATSYCMLALFAHEDPRNMFPLARKAALRALELDDLLAEAHIALANTLLYAEHDWKGAESAFRRAIDLHPNSPQAHGYFTALLGLAGRTEEAIREAEESLRLDPLSPGANFCVGWTLYRARRFLDASRQFERAVERFPRFNAAKTFLAICALEAGELERAMELRRQLAYEASDDAMVLGFACSAAARSGDEKAARDALVRLEALTESGYCDPYYMAQAHLEMGDRETAFRFLQQSVEMPSASSLNLLTSPLMDALRGDPRFDALLRRVGFPRRETESRSSER